MGRPTCRPEISVVIAAYNVEAYIEKAIRSALSQKGVAVEVVVVNDGSTDNTFAMASRLGDLRVKCVSLARTYGPSTARNVGFALSSAPWTAILDGDDLLLPGRLTRVLERARNARADIVIDNLVVFHEANGKESLMYQPSELSRMNTLDLATFIGGNRSFLRGHTLGYVKPVFSLEFLRGHRITYNPELRVGEDYMLLAEALASGAVCAVEATPGYRYTARKGSTSHRLTIQDVIRISEADKKFLKRFELNPAAARAYKQRETNLKTAHAFTALVDALKQRKVAVAFNAIKTCPPAALQLWYPAAARLGSIFK